MLTKVHNLPSIKFDLLLSLSGRSLFHPSSLCFDPPQAVYETGEEMELAGKCAYIDDEDLALINSVLNEKKLEEAPRKTIPIYDADAERAYVKKVILSSQPVGFGLESDLENLLELEPVFTRPDSLLIGSLAEMCGTTDSDDVLAEALKMLSEDFRRWKAAMELERVVLHEETIQYQSPIVQEANQRREDILRESYEGNAFDVNQLGIETRLDNKKQKDSEEREEHESHKQTVPDVESGGLGVHASETCDKSPSKDVTTRSRMPAFVQAQLKSWLRDNRYNPYPTKEEKELLCETTGLKEKQLNIWLTNARRRILPLYLEESF